MLARIMVVGDTHLSSKNRGGHKDYPNESLYYYNYITNLIKEYKCTHCVDLGDFTYGRFSTLEYRREVEKALELRCEAVNSNYYMLKGNHDEATYGLTEYEFYLDKYFKGSTHLDIGNLSLNMVDYGKELDNNIKIGMHKTNVVLAHNYFKFADSILPNYGNPVELDNLSLWAGVKYIISGHIHNEHIQKGKIIYTDIYTNDTYAFDCICHNLPCLSRTNYSSDLPDKGAVVILDVYEDKIEYNRVEIDLLPLEDCFNIENIIDKEDTKEKVDIRDIITELNKFELVVESPEAKIASLDIDERYKNKALELYKNSTEVN